MAVQSQRTITRVLIVGAGGQGRIVADILLAGGEASGTAPVGFVDDDPALAGHQRLGLPVLGPVEQLPMIPHDAIVVAIGDNAIRQRVSLDLEGRGERLISVRHPFSSIARDVTIGAGSMISAGVVIAPCARVGRGVIVNTSASIDHETIVEDFVHISPGATVGANVTIGARTLLGTAAAVMSDRSIGADCMVGAGALVATDLPGHVVAVGVPARVRRHL